MSEHEPPDINQLIGQFTDLQELWESKPDAFDWEPLQALAKRGALAYNEGAGRSFQALAFDGVPHTEYHERFLGYLLQAGFDPFKLSHAGAGPEEIPVIDHGSLAEAAESNPSSARMRTTLMEMARARFGRLAQDIRSGSQQLSPGTLRLVEACAESIPTDLLESIAPELAKAHPGEPRPRKQSVDPVEGYLSTAEVMVDSSRPYG